EGPAPRPIHSVRDGRRRRGGQGQRSGLLEGKPLPLWVHPRKRDRRAFGVGGGSPPLHRSGPPAARGGSCSHSFRPRRPPGKIPPRSPAGPPPHTHAPLLP